MKNIITVAERTWVVGKGLTAMGHRELCDDRHTATHLLESMNFKFLKILTLPQLTDISIALFLKTQLSFKKLKDN